MRTKILSAKTKLYAILGDPISHSLSPVIMNSEFERKHLDCAFLALKSATRDLDAAMKALRIFNLAGYVFTMPLKEAAVPYMDELKDEAKVIEAVNCAKLENGKLIGYNTDSMGFWQAIQNQATGRVGRRGINKAFVMGMGGFAKAAVAQIALQGVKDIVVGNQLAERQYVRSFDQFRERLMMRVPNVTIRYTDWNPEDWKPFVSDADLIANATSNGMYGKGNLGKEFPYESVSKDAVFFDAVYAPLETEFLINARKHGNPTVDGLELLVHQGICSFKIWTGIEAEPKAMRDDAERFMREMQPL